MGIWGKRGVSQYVSGKEPGQLLRHAASWGVQRIGTCPPTRVSCATRDTGLDLQRNSLCPLVSKTIESAQNSFSAHSVLLKGEHLRLLVLGLSPTSFGSLGEFLKVCQFHHLDNEDLTSQRGFKSNNACRTLSTLLGTNHMLLLSFGAGKGTVQNDMYSDREMIDR